MSIGIQESSKSPHNDYLCIGMFCKNCKELIIFELKEMSLINFAFEVLDQETSNKINKKSKDDKSKIFEEMDMPEVKRKVRKRKRNEKSKISVKEINDVKKFLKPKDLPHEEFLIAMGMLPEEIKKYNYKK
jgi:hypothetical protein